MYGEVHAQVIQIAQYIGRVDVCLLLIIMKAKTCCGVVKALAARHEVSL